MKLIADHLRNQVLAVSITDEHLWVDRPRQGVRLDRDGGTRADEGWRPQILRSRVYYHTRDKK